MMEIRTVRARFVLMAVAFVPVVGVVAVVPPADTAEAATKPRPKIQMKLSSSTQTALGAASRATVKVSVRRSPNACTALEGRVRIQRAGRTIASVRVTPRRSTSRSRRAIARLVLPSSLELGTHRLRARFTPDRRTRCRQAVGTTETLTVRSAWQPVYQDTFDAAVLNPRWSRYSGSPSSDQWTTWDPSRVSVEAGALVLDARPEQGSSNRWRAGAVSNWRDAQTYGRWTIRFRSPASSILSYHLLLWPKADRWPPEIDIVEGFDQTRRSAHGFVHWRDDAGVRRRVSHGATGDFTTWNTVRLTWTPDAIVYELNGLPWATVTGAAVPREPMQLALQAETQACNRSAQSCSVDAAGPRPRVEIDDVLMEAYRP